MNEWSRRRKRVVLSIVFVALVVLVGVPLFFLFYRAPSCFDGRQNGDEVGVDCGGSCQHLCTSQSLPLVLKGDPRVLKVADGVYEIVAIINNSNPTAEIYRANYTFKLYDAKGSIPLRTFEGSTFVPKGRTFAVFEGPFNLDPGAVPVRASFSWAEKSLDWRKNAKDTPEINVRNLTISREEASPRLDAIVENASLETVSNIDLVALISDEMGNVFAASKTFVETLAPGEKKSIVFTWPRSFNSKVGSTEVLVRVLPDQSFIR